MIDVPLATLGILFAGPAVQTAKLDTGVLPNQTRIEVRLQQSSATLPLAEVRAAITGAIRAWNAALPATLQLVEVPVSSAYPAGEAIILIRFDADPAHFGGRGADELGDVRRTADRELLNIALLRRAGRDVSGSYSGTLTDTVTKRSLAFRPGEFVVKFDAGKVLLDLKGSKREVRSWSRAPRHSGSRGH